MNLSFPQELPISAQSDDIITAIKTQRVTIIAGDTGSGKTTQLPKMCLAAGRGINSMIGCTQPRRIAALTVADRVAAEIQSQDMVGYKIRFHDHTSKNTRIKFMTDGILLAESRTNRNLTEYDTLIIDEAHERSLNIDFLLGYLKYILKKRKDLKLIISSATIDTDKFSTHFDNAPIINVTGRTHPIDIHYHPVDEENQDNDSGYVDQAVEEIKALAIGPSGDILTFMPTERDIRETIASLEKHISDALILPLFGRLQAKDQRRIFKPAAKRKIIIATNVAETSITVPGIRYVVDTGRARLSRYNFRAKTTHLGISRISQASCDQRTGRCGRTGPGICIRLFSEDDYCNRPEFTQPEIQRSNLAEVILRMIQLQFGDPGQFPFMDPPSGRAINDGYKLLRELRALNKHNQLTKYGKIMSRLPLDPCLSRILIEARNNGSLREIKVIVAALAIQDPRIRPAEKEAEADKAHSRFLDKDSDFLGLLKIWQTYHETYAQVHSQNKMREFCRAHFLSWQRMREWLDIHQQITETLNREKKSFINNNKPASGKAIHRAITSGFLRNIGQKKKKNIYRISGDKEVMIFPGSVLFDKGGGWIISASFVETSRLFARTTANIDVKWLEHLGGDLCRRSWSDPHWEKKSGRVIALEKVTLFGFVIVSNRRVTYANTCQTAKKESREIFIQSALVADDLGGTHRFIKKNTALIREITKMEERLRRRGLVISDEQIFSFYENRLGPDVFDRYTLNKDIKEQKGDSYLLMTKSTICNELPDNTSLYDFPSRLEWKTNNISLKLDYQFQPGHEADGVTVTIPREIISSLNPQRFEWLVPGLLQEKITLLLKALPKNLRRSLVPIPSMVEEILDSIDIGQGSLYVALERTILKLRRITVNRKEWKTEAIPVHLKFRFRLIDTAGKEVMTGRSFQQLASYRPDTIINEKEQKRHVNALKKLDKMGITPEDLATIPQNVSISESGSRKKRGSKNYKIFYPALTVNTVTHQLDLHFVADENTSKETNLHGIRFLYLAQFPKEKKLLARECKKAVTSNSASWLQFGAIKNSAHTYKNLEQFIIDDIFHITTSNLPEKVTFDKRVEEVKKTGLMRTGAEKLKKIQVILSARRTVVAKLNACKSTAKKNRHFDEKRFNNYNEHLVQILPADFLTCRTYTHLKHVDRYYKALIIRIDRAEYSPAKDQAKMNQLAEHQKRLKQIPTDSKLILCRKKIEEYKNMFEEFRVSVFAPEIGTAKSVSAKKLKKTWLEVDNACHQVE